MRAQEPDVGAARALFTELEFTSLVKDFLQREVELGETRLSRSEDRSRGRSGSRLRSRSAVACWPWLWNRRRQRQLLSRKTKPAMRSRAKRLSLPPRSRRSRPLAQPSSVAISAEAGKAMSLPLDESETAAPLQAGAGGRIDAEDCSRLQVGDACFRRAGTDARGRAARSHAVFLSAGSDVFLASAGGDGFAAIQSEAGSALAEAADITLTAGPGSARRSRQSRAAQGV